MKAGSWKLEAGGAISNSDAINLSSKRDNFILPCHKIIQSDDQMAAQAAGRRAPSASSLAAANSGVMTIEDVLLSSFLSKSRSDVMMKLLKAVDSKEEKGVAPAQAKKILDKVVEFIVSGVSDLMI